MSNPDVVSPKSRLATQLLAFFLGIFGAHRFYVGKIQTGLLMLLTLGGLGVWWLWDNIVIIGGGFRDAEGLLVHDWEPDPERLSAPGNAAAIFEELDLLRSEVAELHERVDFAERLLADPKRGEPPTL